MLRSENSVWRVHPRVLSLFFFPRWTPQQFVPPLWAVGTGFLRVVVVQVRIAAVGLLALGHISRHRHSNHLQPALLQLLAFGSEVMDGLGLREAEAGRRVHGPGAVFHRIAQEGDGALCLHVLRRVCGRFRGCGVNGQMRFCASCFTWGAL